MKIRFIKQFAIIYALTMSSMVVLANNTLSGEDQSQDPPVLNGNPKPQKVPSIQRKLTNDARWEYMNNNLLLYIAAEGTATYTIYNELGDVVYMGTTNLHSNRYSSIYIGMLNGGVYSINIECNGVVYSAIFEF